MKGKKVTIIETLNSHSHCSSGHEDKCDIPLHLLGGACLMLVIRKIKPLKFLCFLWTMLSGTGWYYWVCPVQGQSKTSSHQTSVIIPLQGEQAISRSRLRLFVTEREVIREVNVIDPFYQ